MYAALVRRGTAVLGALALLLCGLMPPPAAGAERVQLELVLAVDVSLSVNTEEYYLQIFGLSEAFRHEAVIGAIRSVGDHGIAVTLLQWSDNNQQRVAVEWTRIRDAAGAYAFADRIVRTPRLFVGAGTAITRALEGSISLFWNNGFSGDRLVVDLSGDGIDNRGPTPTGLRDIAAAVGVTINGLAILNEDDDLDVYFLENVIGGTGAFVMTAIDYRDFAVAIRRKLIREISAAPVARAPRPGAEGMTRLAGWFRQD